MGTIKKWNDNHLISLIGSEKSGVVILTPSPEYTETISPEHLFHNHARNTDFSHRGTATIALDLKPARDTLCTKPAVHTILALLTTVLFVCRGAAILLAHA